MSTATPERPPAAPTPGQQVLTPVPNGQAIDCNRPANAGVGQCAGTNRQTKTPGNRPQPEQITDPTDALVDPLVRVVRPLIGN